jgi:hypothetical protein
MAKLSIEGFTDHLDRELRKALDATLREHFPDQNFNSRTVFKTFQEEVSKRCNDWEKIPNKYIRSE